jgi:hypothetical protein
MAQFGFVGMSPNDGLQRACNVDEILRCFFGRHAAFR